MAARLGVAYDLTGKGRTVLKAFYGRYYNNLADAYAKSVVAADLEKPGDDDVVEKVMADFKSRGVAMTEHRLRLRMAETLTVARQQVMSEKT